MCHGEQRGCRGRCACVSDGGAGGGSPPLGQPRITKATNTCLPRGSAAAALPPTAAVPTPITPPPNPSGGAVATSPPPPPPCSPPFHAASGGVASRAKLHPAPPGEP